MEVFLARKSNLNDYCMELFYIVVAAVIISASVIIWWLGENVTVFFTGALVSVLLTLPVYPIVYSIEKSNKETFYEFWNGHELEAVETHQECVRDGRCENTYSCDPYTVTRLETYVDSDGKSQTRTVTETHYHSCPYSSQETTWSVNTSLGSFLIMGNAMTGEPYRNGKSIPGGRVTEPPAFWVEAERRINSGEPSGVTVQKSYKNYILGSDSTIFRQHEADIDSFKSDGLLPAPAKSVHSFYMSDKAYFAGVDEKLLSAEVRAELVSSVQNLNGRAGSELTADVHAVFVDSSVPADLYSSTLHSYWVSPEHGRNSIAKNAVVVIFGVEPHLNAEGVSSEADEEESGVSEVIPEDEASLVIEDGTPVVAWARAFTGMPVGNERFVQSISSLKGSTVDVSLIGKPFYNKETGEYVSESAGKLEHLLFDGATRYERVSMSADDENDVGGGFKYLSESYALSGAGTVIAYVISTVLMVLGLGFALTLASRYPEYDIIVKRKTVEEYFSSKTKKGN